MSTPEASMEISKPDVTFLDGTKKRASAKDLQGKFLALISPVTPVKVYCCVLLIAFLLAHVIGLSVALLVRKTELVIKSSTYASCPRNWIGFGHKCFYFSEDTRNWTFSQTFCASLEANLAQFASMEELNFLKRYKGSSDHWVGLNRESPHHTWKWADNTEYNASFAIRGSGRCAYLNENGISSASIFTDRKWICSKPCSYMEECQITLNSF
uniref:C-type lectin domain-containing protein n=1 Tax=Castor canadensis TaxID=51338 RepID=A0A8C0WPU4_CASCN